MPGLTPRLSLRHPAGEHQPRAFALGAARGKVDRPLSPPVGDEACDFEGLGAGEIVLNCMDSDGVRRGYDIAQLQEARQACQVPLVASGGAGAMLHFAEAFEQADVDGALAASVFHGGSIAIPELKRFLRQRGIEVRNV